MSGFHSHSLERETWAGAGANLWGLGELLVAPTDPGVALSSWKAPGVHFSVSISVYTVTLLTNNGHNYL